MEEKTIRRVMYRVLRKTGIPKEEIGMDASFQDDLNFDKVDWNLFLFYMEDFFNISVPDKEIPNLKRVKDSVRLIANLERTENLTLA